VLKMIHHYVLIIIIITGSLMFLSFPVVKWSWWWFEWL